MAEVNETMETEDMRNELGEPELVSEKAEEFGWEEYLEPKNEWINRLEPKNIGDNTTNIVENTEPEKQWGEFLLGNFFTPRCNAI